MSIISYRKSIRLIKASKLQDDSSDREVSGKADHFGKMILGTSLSFFQQMEDGKNRTARTLPKTFLKPDTSKQVYSASIEAKLCKQETNRVELL